MRWSSYRFLAKGWLLIIMTFIVLSCNSPKEVQIIGLSGEEVAWPTTFPCRVEDGTNPDLFLMSLGKVKTPLAKATYDPLEDKVTLEDGTIIERYFQDKLKVKYFSPLDKKVFPLPPSGWCSW